MLYQHFKGFGHYGLWCEMALHLGPIWIICFPKHPAETCWDKKKNACAFTKFPICNQCQATCRWDGRHDWQALWVELHSHIVLFTVNILQENKGKTVSLLRWKPDAISTNYKYYLNRWNKCLNIFSSVWWLGFGHGHWMFGLCILGCIDQCFSEYCLKRASARNGDCRASQGSPASCRGADPTVF